MDLHGFVTLMDRVHAVARQAPPSNGRDEAVHGIEEATTWGAVTQRGRDVEPAEIIERARNAARLYGRLRAGAAPAIDADGVLRDAFSAAGWRW
jgi:hypothetical protein